MFRANRNGGKEVSDTRPGLVSRFREVSCDLLVHLHGKRTRKIFARSREVKSTWWTSLVSSCAAFSASLSKKSELAFGDGGILKFMLLVVTL